MPPIDVDELTAGIEDPEERKYRIAEAVMKEKGITYSKALPVAEEYIRNVQQGLISERPFGSKTEKSRMQMAAESLAPEMVRSMGYTTKVAPSWSRPLATEEQPSDVAPSVIIPTGPGQASQVGAQMPSMQMPGIPGTGTLKSYQSKLGKQGTKIGKAFEKAQERYGEVAADQITATWMQANAEMARNEAETTVLEHATTRALEYEGQLGVIERQRKTYVQGEMAKLQNAVTQFRQMKVDPYRLFRNSDGSTDYPRKVTAAIAVFLGALGERMQGRAGNPALDVINQAIDRDIASQQADLQKAQAGIGIQFNVLGAMRQIYDDERSAVLAAKNVMMEHAKLELEKVAAQTESPIIQARAMKGMADIDARQAEFSTQLEMSANEVATRLIGEQAGLEAQRIGLGMQRAGMLQQREMLMAKAVQSAGGKQLPANAVAKIADFRGARRMIDQVEEAWRRDLEGDFTAGLSQYAPWATKAKSFDDMIRMAAQFIGKKLEGRMTDEDYARIKGFMPSPGDSTERAMDKLASLRGFLDAMNDETINTYAETGFDVSGFARQGPVEGFRRE